MTKKQQLIAKIKNFENKYFNEDQKNIAVKIIENAPSKQVQQYADFIFMKRKTGFAFDYSPEIAKGRLITLREDVERRINVQNNIEDNENKLIIGDNYNALKSLLITHKNKVDLIYIDPPYNTETAKKDGNQSSKEGEASKFIYKDKFGRGGWLNMMKERLTLAKDLLSDDGVIFVSIDDTEQAYLKVLMDDIFGEINFLATIIFNKTSQGGTFGKGFKKAHEYIICFSKTQSFNVNYELLKNQEKYKEKDSIGKYHLPNKLSGMPIEKNQKRGYTIYYNLKTKDLVTKKEYDLKTYIFDQYGDRKLINLGYKRILPLSRQNKLTAWKWCCKTLQKKYKTEIIFKKDQDGKLFPYPKNRQKETRTPLTIQNFDSRKDGVGVLDKIFDGERVFDFAKPLSLIKWIVDRHKKQNILILDFFAGSGTTGHAVMQLNREDGGKRKFILCTNNESNIAHNVTFERLHRLIKGEGTKGEKNFDWLKTNSTYSKEKLRVINIDDSVNISLKENMSLGYLESKKIEDDCLNGLKLLSEKYDKKDINLYYDLAALNPLENKKDLF